jgi:hypothetical protein
MSDPGLPGHRRVPSGIAAQRRQCGTLVPGGAAPAGPVQRGGDGLLRGYLKEDRDATRRQHYDLLSFSGYVVSVCASTRAPASRSGSYPSPDRLVGEERKVIDGLVADQAHELLAAGLAEQAPAGPEHDRVDHQPQLVDEVVLEQHVHELEAGGDDDVPGAAVGIRQMASR